MRFFDRTEEIASLRKIREMAKNNAQFTVVTGRRRIGKTSLVWKARFRKHILEEKREYLLPDGRMILLPEEWFSKYANLLEMGIQTEKGIRLKHTFVGAAQTALRNVTKTRASRTDFSNIRSTRDRPYSWGARFRRC